LFIQSAEHDTLPRFCGVFFLVLAGTKSADLSASARRVSSRSQPRFGGALYYSRQFLFTTRAP
jgi:hypothetical protein